MADDRDRYDSGNEERLVAGIVDALEERDRRSGRDRRQSPDSDFVGHAKAADAGVSMAWRWGQMLTTIIGFFFMAGMMYAQFTTFGSRLETLAKEFSQFRDERVKKDLDVALDHQKLEQLQATVTDLKRENEGLRSQVDTTGKMLTSIVYSSANAALRKQPNIMAPPPGQ